MKKNEAVKILDDFLGYFEFGSMTSKGNFRNMLKAVCCERFDPITQVFTIKTGQGVGKSFLLTWLFQDRIVVGDVFGFDYGNNKGWDVMDCQEFYPSFAWMDKMEKYHGSVSCKNKFFIMTTSECFGGGNHIGIHSIDWSYTDTDRSKLIEAIKTLR